MSGTYVAWNGQPYPWPPPEGWYEGSDGRWWAPGSGPEPDRAAAQAEAEALAAEAAEETAAVDNAESELVGPADSDQQTIITKPTQRPLPGHADSAGAATDYRSTDDVQTGSTVAERQDGSVDGGREPEPEGSSNVLVLAVGAAVLLLIGAGVVALLNRGDDSGTAASGPSEPSTTLAAGETTVQTLTTQLPATPDTDTAPPPTTQPDQTSTTASGTATTSSDTPSTDQLEAADAALATTWRETLGDRGIDTTELSDEDIIDFGKSFCVFAVVSVDAEEFDTFRDKAQTGVAGSLTDAQLTAAIDSAVVTFCPEDAERLGITL